MEDEDKYEDAQTYTTCPYNPAHTFPKFRMSRHLVKCRRQHVEQARDLRTCPFNNNHQIPQIELPYHETVCSDREIFYNYTHKMEEKYNVTVDKLNQNTMVPLDIPESNENWDDEIDPNQDIISAVRESAEERCVLQSNSNEPPAERKAKRAEQRMKAREKSNMEDERNRMSAASSSSSYATDDARSVASSSRTDVTYNTARNTTERFISGIPPTNSPRGRGKLISQQKSCEMGIGRGRRLE